MLRIDISLKKAWKDLNAKDILNVSALLLEDNNREQFLMKAFMKLHNLEPLQKDPAKDFGLCYWFRINKGQPFTLDVNTITALAQSMSFLKDEISEMLPVPFKWRRAPHQRLYNLTVEQYLAAENFYMAYSQTKKLQYLQKLAATLYPPLFSSFNEKKLKKRTRYFTKQNSIALHAVFLFYTGARRYLKSRFVNIYKEKTVSEAFNKKAMTAMVRALNGGDVTRNKDIYKAPLYEALEQLDDMAEQAEKLKTP